MVRSSAPPILKGDLKGKIRWLIGLRWIAALGLFAAITATRFLLEIPLPLAPLYAGNLFLFVYNAACHLGNRTLRKGVDSAGWLPKAHLLANVQISVDLAVLTYLLYFSGGMDNPFMLYYIFHVIISSILLTNRSAYLQATFATVLVGAVMGGEYTGILPQFRLAGFTPNLLVPDNLPAFLWRFLVFSSTLYIAVYLTTTIANRLRVRERELEISNEKLEKQDRIKSQYVMTVSHDIQASLSTISSCLETVLSGHTGEVSPESTEMIERSVRRTGELLRFVRDLLDISRMRAEPEIEMTRFSLDGLVRAIVERYASELAQKRILCSVDTGPMDSMIEADETAIERLVANLMENAVRYTPEGGRIVLALSEADSGDHGWLRLSVADSGIGIPPDSMEHIFEDFYRAKNAKTFMDGGTGLGLAIVKRIVEMHSGRVSVDSELGTGTTFTVLLPRTATHSSPVVGTYSGASVRVGQ